MSDNGFIFMLLLSAGLLSGILVVAHVSAYRLNERRQLRRKEHALAPDLGRIIEPELDLRDTVFGVAENAPTTVSVQIRHAETAR